ncbi:hypothetical protein FISHEDRAFT_75839 [Fistulina hepatica ATCC 64428]|uniref:Uncharacterized protein n=1 Tax=Fistulina hepatica ATCC 64428 TaxID=1128425 RepID=A0A0D7A773_9AGAR|nr:hypothetical protein FISHEDRAFT_75839 [Fistulina hepatica ATCC 64428]
MGKTQGVSHKVIISGYAAGQQLGKKPTKLSLKDQQQEKVLIQQHVKEGVKGLSHSERELLQDYTTGNAAASSVQEDAQVNTMIQDMTDGGAAEDDWVDVPTDDGTDKFMGIIQESIFRYRGHHNKRTWAERATRLEQNWTPVMPTLIQAYLAWKYPPTQQAQPSCVSTPDPPAASAISPVVPAVSNMPNIVSSMPFASNMPTPNPTAVPRISACPAATASLDAMDLSSDPMAAPAAVVQSNVMMERDFNSTTHGDVNMADNRATGPCTMAPLASELAAVQSL